jgi:membrane protein DedA with SNARE-associated domain
MEFITEFLSSYSSETILLGYAILLAITLLGLAPSNSDMVIVAGVVLSLAGSLEFYQVILTCLSLIVLIESMLYLIGYRWGEQIFSYKLVLRFFSKEKQEKFRTFSNLNPQKLIIMIRLTPLLRPYLTLFMGAIKLTPKMFFPRHAIITSSYVCLLSTGTFYFGQLIKELPPTVMNILIALIFMMWILFMRKLKKDFKNHF